MRLEQIDYFIRMVCVGETLILGGMAITFWVIGLSYNQEFTKEAAKYWCAGLGLLFLLTLLILLSIYPDRTAGFLPTKHAYIIVRIPIYVCVALATAVLVRAH